MISRPYRFLLFFLLAFFNPITLWLVGTSRTFIVVVPFTLLVWFAARWSEIEHIDEKSGFAEMLFGVGIYGLVIAYNVHRYLVVGVPKGEAEVGFGLIDMLAAFVSVCIAFYGFNGTRKHFILPTAYLSTLIVGYELEFRLPEVTLLQNFLAGTITSALNLFNISASVNGSMVTFNDTGIILAIDRDCTGIKSILAYGSLAVLMVLDVTSTYARKAFTTIIGFVGTFFVNILRLLTIFFTCHFFGLDAALTVHIYLGYLVFIVWVLIFWSIAFKYLLTPKNQPLK